MTHPDRNYLRNGRLANPSECLSLLSRKRQELIRPVFEDPREYVLLSARRLAQRLEVDSATAVRVVQRMGFSSYKEFQRYLHELAICQATTVDTISTTELKDSSLGAHASETIERDIRNLQQLRTNLDFERIATLAKRIHAAGRIFLIGGDLAACLVEFLHYHLILLGLPAVKATSTGEMLHLIRAAGDQDLTIAMSFRRCLRQTVEGMKQAKSSGAYCVGITNTFVSPIARFADEFFVASVDGPSFGISYTAPQCLLNGIVAACGYCRPERSEPFLTKAAEEQRKGFRWYPD